MGTTRYQQEYVRSRLNLINCDVLRNALFRFTENQTKIRNNALYYATKILFSCLTEKQKAGSKRRLIRGLLMKFPPEAFTV